MKTSSLMPANARIIPLAASKSILVTDTSLNLKKIYSIIKENDVETKATKK